MQDTIENYIRDINKIPELIEIESKTSNKNFSMKFLLELKEYMVKNKMICREIKIEDCIVENLKLSNAKNKKENEEIFLEYRQLFPKENINGISVFIEKYVEYLSKKIDLLASSKSYLETPKILEKEIMDIITRENYHNVFLISNYGEVKLFVSRLIDKCYKEYLEQIKLVSYQVGLGYFQNKSEMLENDLKQFQHSPKIIPDNEINIEAINTLPGDIISDYTVKETNISSGKITKGDVLPGDVLSDYDRKIENNADQQIESSGEVLPGGLIL